MLHVNYNAVLLLATLSVATPLSAAKDPTAPPTALSETTSPQAQAYTFALSMIISDGKQRKAIINESLVGVKDVINNAVVIAIKQDSVVLRQGDKTINLTLPYAEVRKDREHE